MAVAETELPNPPNPRGEAMVAELKWVHDMIRRDLRTVRRMAADVAAGQPAQEIEAAIRSLAAGGPLWQLKANCLQYCRFVHSHHHAESVMLFPGLRRANPALNPVVDKLEADHLQGLGPARRRCWPRRGNSAAGRIPPYGSGSLRRCRA